VGTEWARTRCRERLEALADSGCDLDELRQEAIAALRRAIGFDRWCALLVDPDSLLFNRGIGENDWARDLPRINLHEAGARDDNNLLTLARGPSRVESLDVATSGDLAANEGWREIFAPYGVGDELRAAVVDDYGCWGDLHVWRSSDDRVFDEADASLMRDASRVLARALRRGAVAPAVLEPTAPKDTGVLLLDEDLRQSGATGSARAWFAALNPAGMAFPEGIPNVVWSAVGRLLADERHDRLGTSARVRVRAGDGSWATVEAARLDAGRGIAVSLRPALPEEILALLTRAYGLTARERELVELLIEGLATREIGDRLQISQYTVQDHLKSVFDKVGVRSRHELITGLFAQAA
jgi:DNA-binding CsgD family transcriptional regulator